MSPGITECRHRCHSAGAATFSNLDPGEIAPTVGMSLSKISNRLNATSNSQPEPRSYTVDGRILGRIFQLTREEISYQSLTAPPPEGTPKKSPAWFAR